MRFNKARSLRALLCLLISFKNGSNQTLYIKKRHPPPFCRFYSMIISNTGIDNGNTNQTKPRKVFINLLNNRISNPNKNNGRLTAREKTFNKYDKTYKT